MSGVINCPIAPLREPREMATDYATHGPQAHRSFELLRELAERLRVTMDLADTTAGRLLQGPLAGAMGHAGQLVLLRRLSGSPIPPEDWFCYVAAAPDGQLVGFAKGEPHDGGVPGFEGELDKIYVLRAWHRSGIGRALVEQVARRFLAQGVASMLLFGDARNPSNGFYERLGAERLFSPEGEFHGGYGWRDLRRLVPDALST
jgi:GNAT superfamily N-acetyltransferase